MTRGENRRRQGLLRLAHKSRASVNVNTCSMQPFRRSAPIEDESADTHCIQPRCETLIWPDELWLHDDILSACWAANSLLKTPDGSGLLHGGRFSHITQWARFISGMNKICKSMVGLFSVLPPVVQDRKTSPATRVNVVARTARTLKLRHVLLVPLTAQTKPSPLQGNSRRSSAAKSVKNQTTKTNVPISCEGGAACRLDSLFFALSTSRGRRERTASQIGRLYGHSSSLTVHNDGGNIVWVVLVVVGERWGSPVVALGPRPARCHGNLTATAVCEEHLQQILP